MGQRCKLVSVKSSLAIRNESFLPSKQIKGSLSYRKKYKTERRAVLLVSNSNAILPYTGTMQSCSTEKVPCFQYLQSSS